MKLRRVRTDLVRTTAMQMARTKSVRTLQGFKVEIGTAGDLQLKWKNTNASGAVYQIFRKLGASGTFEYLGGVGTKKFNDTTVPAGTAQVQYQIQAVRSQGIGEWALYVVNLGSGANSPVSIVEATPAKLAA